MVPCILASLTLNKTRSLYLFKFKFLLTKSFENNIFSSEVITNLKVGETLQLDKTQIKFESIEKKNINNYAAVIGKFQVKDKDGNTQILNPELRIYNQPNIVTSEAD